MPLPSPILPTVAIWPLVGLFILGAVMRRTAATIALTLGLLASTTAPALADPNPPTNGGNGAGQSGQCTGPQDDRPSSCHSQGGPGNQP